MTDPQPDNPRPVPAPPRRLRRWVRLRPLVQLAFAVVWLWPASALRIMPSCVFHCYGCALSNFACPVGLAANFSALHIWPLMVLGIVVAAGALVGSLICGWACPFGFFQDLAGRIPTRKFAVPAWMSYGRYVVLIGLVIAVPYILGGMGVPYDDQNGSICSVCPAGALEAGVPNMAKSIASGQFRWAQWEQVTLGQASFSFPVKLLGMRWYKTVILGAFVVSLLVVVRPWCMVLCPLGGLLALFNRISVFHLRFRRTACYECNTCRTRCPMGVKVEQRVNVTRCIRCLNCTTCGAIGPSLGKGKE